MLERLQKIIAHAGLASRREAEVWIKDGEVTINGKVAKLGDQADPTKDAIKVRGKLLKKPDAPTYYLAYKPKNCLCKFGEDEEGRATLDGMSKDIKGRVFPVTKLDFSFEGAVLLSNDGQFTEMLQRNRSILRAFHIKVHRVPTDDEIARLRRGGMLDGRRFKPHSVNLQAQYQRNALVELVVRGSKTPEFKPYFEGKGLFIEKVTLKSIGHIAIEGMEPGQVKVLAPTTIEALSAQPELAERDLQRKSLRAKKKLKKSKD